MEFWNSLGNPKFIAAPMVELSELPFRMLCRKYGAQLTYTPMLHSSQFVSCPKYREKHFQTAEGDHPLFAQFCGHDAETMLQAASFVENDVEAVDINLGCPQGIARKGKYGAFLLEQPDIIIKVLSTLHASLSVPVTCKIRKVSDNLQDTLNLCYALQANGCAALCVHGRTKEEKAQQVDACDWDTIKIIKQRLDIPVISNGGIDTYDDILNCLEYTGADAVMSAEGILDYPALFSGNASVDRLKLANEYMEMQTLYPHRSNSCIKAHLFKILHGRLEKIPKLRQTLALASDWDGYTAVLEELQHQPAPTAYSRWYLRHRKAILA